MFYNIYLGVEYDASLRLWLVLEYTRHSKVIHHHHHRKSKHSYVCVCVSFMPAMHGPDYRIECDPFYRHRLGPSEPVAQSSFVCYWRGPYYPRGHGP